MAMRAGRRESTTPLMSPGKRESLTAKHINPNASPTVVSHQPPPAQSAPPSDNCFLNFRSFVRVRPFKDLEAKHIPQDQIVPRPALDYTPENETLTVLDPTNKFKPKKNGAFALPSVLWSFDDPDATPDMPARQLQADVYNKVVTPVMASIEEGYGAAFCVYGVADTGKMTTMFGDEQWTGGNRGLFPRFCEDLFDTMIKQKKENVSITVEVECVEIVNEQFNDLLAAKKVSQELKIREDPIEGLVLQGCTRVLVDNASVMEDVVRIGTKAMRKRKNAFVVTVRLTELHAFKDPENPDAPETTKSRRINVNFAVLRAMPTSFHRCVDVAIERDTDVNPNAKPPTREGAFCKLFADIFNLNINVSMISCVSPFCKDVKDTLTTLGFAAKVAKIKTYPKQNHDQSMMELRRLQDEMDTLDRHVTKTNASIQVVQQELDRRAHELAIAKADHEELSAALAEVESRDQESLDFHQKELDNHHLVVVARNAELGKIKAEITAVQKSTAQTIKTSDGVRSQRHAVEDRIAKVDADKEKQQGTNQIFDDELAIYNKEEAEVAKMESFVQLEPAERQETVTQLVAQTVTLKQEAPKLKAAVEKAREEQATAAEREGTTQKEHAAIKAKQTNADAKKKELETKTADIKRLEKEIASMEAEKARMDDEIAKAPKGCGCAIM